MKCGRAAELNGIAVVSQERRGDHSGVVRNNHGLEGACSDQRNEERMGKNQQSSARLWGQSTSM